MSDFNAFGVPWLGLKLLVLLSIYNIIRVLLHCVCARAVVSCHETVVEHRMTCPVLSTEKSVKHQCRNGHFQPFRAPRLLQTDKRNRQPGPADPDKETKKKRKNQRVEREEKRDELI